MAALAAVPWAAADLLVANLAGAAGGGPGPRGRGGRGGPGRGPLGEGPFGRGGPGAFFGGPFGGGPWGPGRHRRGGRGRGDVRTALLLLLAERPMHGYEMISELESRSGGLWRPSPGSVYPTLQLLEDEGLVVASQEDSRRRYALTDAGREVAATLAEGTPPWSRVEDEADGATLGLRRATMTTVAAARQVAIAGDEEQRRAAIAILADARRRLYRLLGEEAGESEGEPA